MNLLNDVEETDDARLWRGLRGFSQRLSEVLLALPASSPVLLSGDWGAGKTTALRAVQRHLAEHPAGRPTVWFDAWRHETEPVLLPALMRAVWDAAPADYRAKREARSLFRMLFQLALVVGTRVAPELLLGVGAKVAGGMMKGLTAAAVSGDVAALGDGGGAPEPDASRLLWQQFSALVSAAWGGKAPIVLVDDLDRCGPLVAVQLLDGIRLLVTGGAELHCNFVVALDRSVMARAIGHKMKGISGYDGNRYLEKIFPVAFAVPTPYEGDAADLIAEFLASGDDGDRQRSVLMEVLSRPVFANPRLLKRCINRYRLLAHFESTLPTLAGAGSADAASLRRDRAAATWIAATERWPAARPLLLRRDEGDWEALFKASSQASEPAQGALDPELAALADEPGFLPWLKKELGPGGANVALLREADQRLRRWGM